MERRGAACEASMRPKLRDHRFDLGVKAVFGLAALLLAAPTIIVLITSFTGGATIKFPPPTWSVRPYIELLAAPEILLAAWTSLVVAICATAAAGLLGTLAALGIARSRHI